MRLFIFNIVVLSVFISREVMGLNISLSKEDDVVDSVTILCSRCYLFLKPGDNKEEKHFAILREKFEKPVVDVIFTNNRPRPDIHFGKVTDDHRYSVTCYSDAGTQLKFKLTQLNKCDYGNYYCQCYIQDGNGEIHNSTESERKLISYSSNGEIHNSTESERKLISYSSNGEIHNSTESERKLIPYSRLNIYRSKGKDVIIVCSGCNLTLKAGDNKEEKHFAILREKIEKPVVDVIFTNNRPRPDIYFGEVTDDHRYALTCYSDIGGYIRLKLTQVNRGDDGNYYCQCYIQDRNGEIHNSMESERKVIPYSNVVLDGKNLTKLDKDIRSAND